MTRTTDIVTLKNATLAERLSLMQESTRDTLTDHLRATRFAFEQRLVEHVAHRLTQTLDAVMGE